jgi:hypothetical protein
MEEITSLDQIEMLPGYELIEFHPGYTILKIPSGFTVKISRLPPFMLDLVDTGALRDPGPFKIKVRLLANLRPDDHIEQEILWDPPKDKEGNIIVPEWNEEDKGFAYYKQWEMHESNRREIFGMRAQKRWEIILQNSIEVLNGPVEMESDDWLEPLLGVIERPKTYAERKILFMKTQVVYPEQVLVVLGFFVNVQEVTLEGLYQAFDSFRSTIRWNSDFSALRAIAGRGSAI